jgi:hypothetical protein
MPERSINPDAQKNRTRVYIKNSRISNCKSLTNHSKLSLLKDLHMTFIIKKGMNTFETIKNFGTNLVDGEKTIKALKFVLKIGVL